MNDNKLHSDGNNKDKVQERETRIFLAVVAVFLVACLGLYIFFDIYDRTQYVNLEAVPTTSLSDIIPESERININTASKEELMTLNGIGSVMADNIIYYREHYNGFLDVDELMEVKGIGKKTLDKLKPYITA